MDWDEVAARFDLVKIRPLLGGRIRIGYPPAVGAAGAAGAIDVNLTGERLLSDNHLIGRVTAGTSPGWTFALPAFAGREIVELPCGRRAVFDDWIIDTGRTCEIREHPAGPLRGVVRSPDGARVYLYNSWRIACYDRDGHAWTSPGLFNADMASVRVEGDEVSCLGFLDWIEPGTLFELRLSVATGEIVGGDAEALAAHRA